MFSLYIFSLELNLVARYTFWALTIGGTITYVQIAAVNQNMVQRYLALPSLSDAKKYCSILNFK